MSKELRLAVFSDIHSNRTAFLVCVDYIKKHPVDGLIFLGDNVSDCPNPEATLEIIRELDREYPVWHIKGNREQYFIDHADGAGDGWTYSSYQGSLLYTYEHLTREDIGAFRQYESTRVITIPGTKAITIAHGSPRSLRELLWPGRENTADCLERLDTDYLLCGHTHLQCCYSRENRLYLNPGSIGVAIGRPACADFAILEWKNGRWEFELLSLPFDLERVRKEFAASSLMEKAYVWPKCILASMEKGVNMGPLCAKAAYDLASRESGREDAKVAERHWRQAARQLGII